MDKAGNTPKFALIIPTAGRASELKACLHSLALHVDNYTQFSFFAIDNNCDRQSSDNVAKICEAFPFVRLQRCGAPGLSAARHLLLQYSNADVFCFVDDDVTFTEAWLDSIVQTFLDDEICLAGGPSIPLFTGSVPEWFWDFFHPTPYGGWACPWLSLLDIGHDVDDINPNWIWGLNFAIRRDVLLDCGGFHVDLVPKQFMRWQGDGETGLTMKLAAKGYKAVYRQKSLLFHQCGPERLNSSYFVKRAFYQGVCNSFSELRHTLRSRLDVAPVSPARQSLLRRAISKAKRSLNNSFQLNQSAIQIQTPWAESAAEVRKLCQQAEREGYLFHQREAEQDPLLREWISRDNYLDVDLRDLHLEYQKTLSAPKASSD
jgi:GT2 family glycosyltransferase